VIVLKKGVIILIVIGAIFIALVAFVRPLLFEKAQRSTSDSHASTKTIRIGGDDYLGYWFMTSPEMKIQSPRKGFTIDFSNDKGAYAERLQKFDKREYDVIVLPINSYLRHGAKYKFPGVITSGVCESKGADAIVGCEGVLPSGKINDLNTSDIEIYYTGESPSSFLLDLVISDFGMDELKGDNSWRKEMVGCDDVFEQARKSVKDCSVAKKAFVLWEPNVSKAVDELGFKYLWGSDKFGGYIIDVFVFNRNFVSKNPELVKTFLSTYFRVLDRYSADKERLIKEMSKTTGLKTAAVKNMIDKIDWFDLNDNCNRLFGVQTDPAIPAEDRIVNAIIQCATVMERSNTFNQDDLPDPYLIVNSGFLSDLSKSAIRAVGSGSSAVQAVEFPALANEDWGKIREVGVMRVDPISFRSGLDELDDDGKAVVDKVAALLVNNYPKYRVAVRGHTGSGDEDANRKLSMERAQVVMQRLLAVHNINANRLHAEGLGSSQPPKAKVGESERSLRLRMPRVEFVLLEGNNL
jgi:outer membrane protein OmpA-like peptidoglycan-associated protein